MLPFFFVKIYLCAYGANVKLGIRNFVNFFWMCCKLEFIALTFGQVVGQGLAPAVDLYQRNEQARSLRCSRKVAVCVGRGVCFRPTYQYVQNLAGG